MPWENFLENMRIKSRSSKITTKTAGIYIPPCIVIAPQCSYPTFHESPLPYNIYPAGFLRRVSLLCSQEKSKAITFLGNRKVMWRLSTDLRELRLPDLKVQFLCISEINATPWEPQWGKTLAPQIILPRPIYSLLTILSLGYTKSLKTLCRALILFVLNLQAVFPPVN